MKIRQKIIAKSIITLSSLCLSTNILASSIPDFTYYDSNRIREINKGIDSEDQTLVNALETITIKANKTLSSKVESVIDKPAPAPSGDMNDYLSISPYFWPDSEKEDGMPWLYRDGKINPLTRGSNTDQVKAARFLNNMGDLFVAYLHTDDDRYSKKMLDYINTWIVNPETRMNPNLSYAQGIPGRNDGSCFGIIEWKNINNLISSVELLKHRNKLDEQSIDTINNWFSEYLNWLISSDLGREEKTRLNNHGSWYDYQVIGLHLYLDKNDDAEKHLDFTKFRIGQQFNIDGMQHNEVTRTKSISYSSMNLSALIQIAYMAQKVDVNLWDWTYLGDDGIRLEKGISYLYPYILEPNSWEYQQINMPIDRAIKTLATPVVYKALQTKGDINIPDKVKSIVYKNTDAKTILLY
ncbi:hypothetical protein RJ45_06615 [Photobacterium gaetbulicola]|uniref:Alginate lyase domain-containing protein n=1 Tax=Photobacterium gaetbulicola TaxID=1295392 RepID=A0A0B9G6W1_9GAMM|nr:alginate lyase family protein [Photobacterium gaetbulicola]KHT64384.1 hypothetical protein RJ45_06615 [Photobacterium gaetbulicola]